MKKFAVVLKVMGILLALLLGVLLILWFIGLIDIERGPAFEKPAEFPVSNMNVKATLFEMMDTAGIDTAEFANQMLLLNFWDRGCSHCLAELPVLDQLHTSLSKSGTVLSFFNSDSITAAALFKKYHLQFKYPMIYHLIGSRSITKKICARSGFDVDTLVDAVPFSCLIDKDGTILICSQGEITRKELKKWTDLIQQKTP
ncbi:MAG: redoxin family protein [Chitinophagales bacterium]